MSLCQVVVPEGHPCDRLGCCCFSRCSLLLLPLLLPLLLHPQYNKGAEIPFWMKTLSGMSSGAIAVTIGTPMDVALVRMQSDSMKPKNERRNYKHVIDALRRCAAEEGIGALYAVSATYCRHRHFFASSLCQLSLLL